MKDRVRHVDCDASVISRWRRSSSSNAARIEPAAGYAEARYVLLADPDATLMEPLLRALLLRRSGSTDRLWDNARWATLRLREVL